MVLAACISLSCVSLMFTYLRYREIARISLDIDRLLHGNDTIRFEEYQEGELFVLQNELSKMAGRLTEQAETLKKEKSYLADALADISHQLKTSLTSLNILNASLAREHLEDEKRLEMVQRQMFLLSRMEWLIVSLLKISQLDAGTIQLEKQEAPMKKLIRLAVSPLEVSAEMKDQVIETNIEENAVFNGDLRWMAEAVGNILKNCMEHTPAGGKIEIAARETPLMEEIVIMDNGKGIAAKDLPHLFERFYRGDNTVSNHVGIGLALAKMIVIRQDGTLTAENRKTGGAKFTIRLRRDCCKM